MAAAQATSTVPRALPVIPAAEVYPSRDSYHAGEDQRTEREARQLWSSPAHFELRIRGEHRMLDYLRGAPSQRTTALGASIDRNAIMGGDSRVCPRCRGTSVLRPKPLSQAALDMLGLVQANARPQPACRVGELIGAPRIDRGGKLISGRYSRDEDLDDPQSDYAIVRALAGGDVARMEDALRDFEPWCGRCRGNGHIPSARRVGKTVEVESTGSSKAPWRDFHEPAAELVAFGAASATMRAVSEADPMFEPVLVAYFGATGARFAGSVFGKVFAVYPFTRAGQLMLERTKNRAGEADPWQRIWELATGSSRKRDVAALVQAAGIQGVALLRHAGAAWDTVMMAVSKGAP